MLTLNTLWLDFMNLRAIQAVAAGINEKHDYLWWLDFDLAESGIFPNEVKGLASRGDSFKLVVYGLSSREDGFL